MATIQDKSPNGQKQEKKSNAIFAVFYFGKVNQKRKEIKDTSVLLNAMDYSEKKNCRKKNTTTGKEVSLHIKHTDGGSKNIPNEWHILKQDDMLGKEMQRGRILLKNGKNFAKNIIGDVLNVIRKRSSPKTTLNHFQKKAQIIFQIFSHFVGRVIVGNGNSTRTQNYSLNE